MTICSFPYLDLLGMSTGAIGCGSVKFSGRVPFRVYSSSSIICSWFLYKNWKASRVSLLCSSCLLSSMSIFSANSLISVSALAFLETIVFPDRFGVYFLEKLSLEGEIVHPSIQLCLEVEVHDEGQIELDLDLGLSYSRFSNLEGSPCLVASFIGGEGCGGDGWLCFRFLVGGGRNKGYLERKTGGFCREGGGKAFGGLRSGYGGRKRRMCGG
ncbi:uncharacterized protein G2W53_039587 [Senna tora]|uniref:Uncharacterized protein n=1 Tax=Senna tora TaxID=362788 RepID=A0A834W6A3_9FABA|nr:uncharacterized protein G2W53_039587 [Senna tora]